MCMALVSNGHKLSQCVGYHTGANDKQTDSQTLKMLRRICTFSTQSARLRGLALNMHHFDP
jgi:hypothetical protein